MNKQPVYYMQTDPRWRDKDYSAPGESTTVGKSGCGPTCAAMLIETLTGKKFTPLDACLWSLRNGYKAKNQGTYYSYFEPQFKAHGIACERLNTANLYGKATSPVHDKAFKMLKQGYYLIACMGKGLWTSGGHYIVVWWENGKVSINDPNSTKSTRQNGDLGAFKGQVKYYWAVDGRKHNKQGGETVTIELPVLKKGSKGKPVKTLQMLLTAKGFDTEGVDGSFGANTQYALKLFQKSVGITIDGSCGRDTWTALLTK